MESLFNGKLLIKSIKLIFILAVFLLFANGSLKAATSPDAIAFRVIPNPNYLSPLKWYQENIKVKGSPQAMIVDGYEAIRDGRTVYVNAANISDANFYTNIYIISYNQQAESATIDIFGQILSHWKFNTNLSTAGSCVQPDKYLNGSCLIDSDCLANEYCDSQKAKIIRDTKRLADLAEIKSILGKFKTQNGYYPRLASGSYLANITMSVWPSWKNTLASDLKSSLPIDPLNRLGLCDGYDKITCWNSVTKKFAGADTDGDGQLNLPSCSFVYIYTATAAASYNICAIMESGYITTLAKGACAGSTVSHGATCTDTVWTPKYDPANVCTDQRILETSNCGKTRNILYGSKTATAPNCADDTCVGKTCDNGCKTISGAKTTGECCILTNPSCTADNTCAGSTCNNGCATITGTKTDGRCICTLPWGGTIAPEQTVTAYQASSVPYGSGCVDEQRQCRDGRLTGSYGFQSCAVLAASSCASPWGGVAIPHDQDITAYQASSVACGSSCSSLTRRCNNGTLSGDNNYEYQSCTVGSTVTLNNINNATIYTNPSGVTATLYKTPVRFNFTASVSTPEPVSFSMTGNPAWLQINPTAGVISGEQTNNVDSSYTIEVIATNSCGNSDSKNFILNVKKNEWCGDTVKNGTEEQCDKNEPGRNCAAQAAGLPSYCSSLVISGTKSCKDDCSDWNTCYAPPTIISETSTGCDYTDAPLSDYACCELLRCSQDGCGCCGNVEAIVTNSKYPNYENKQSLDVVWYSSQIPPAYYQNCAGGYRDGTSYLPPPPNNIPFLCTRCGEKITPGWNNNNVTNGCRLNKSTVNNRDWLVTTDHSTAYYRCWK